MRTQSLGPSACTSSGLAYGTQHRPRVIGDTWAPVSEKMKTEGAAEREKGKAREEGGKVAGRVQGKAEKAAGAAQRKAGSALGNDEMQQKGKMREAKGDARDISNR